MTAKQKTYKKILKYVGQTIVILFITLCLFEMSYRYYWIDFYSAELTGLNSEENLSLSKEKTLLIFGDSFSAQPDGWVSVIADSLVDWNVINSAIPGTSVFHQNIIFKDRVASFNPDCIIVQLYVGNDLIDYERPINYGSNGFFRNVYWSLSDCFISLQFINYKMGQFSFSKGNSDPKNDPEFNVSTYNKREVLYHQADSLILDNSINLKGNQKDVFDDLLEDLTEMLEEITVPVYILVIPHSCQISEEYKNNIEQIGAHLSSMESADYPFYQGIKSWSESKANVEVINALPLLKEWNKTHPVYYKNDPHLNKNGERVITDLIFNSINF